MTPACLLFQAAVKRASLSSHFPTGVSLTTIDSDARTRRTVLVPHGRSPTPTEEVHVDSSMGVVLRPKHPHPSPPLPRASDPAHQTTPRHPPAPARCTPPTTAAPHLPRTAETQQQSMGRDKVAVSLGNAEAYTGGPHANLAPYGWANCGFAPASQSIYGGMTLNVGIGVSACLRPWPGFASMHDNENPAPEPLLQAVRCGPSGNKPAIAKHRKLAPTYGYECRPS